MVIMQNFLSYSFIKFQKIDPPLSSTSSPTMLHLIFHSLALYLPLSPTFFSHIFHGFPLYLPLSSHCLPPHLPLSFTSSHLQLFSTSSPTLFHKLIFHCLLLSSTSSLAVFHLILSVSQHLSPQSPAAFNFNSNCLPPHLSHSCNVLLIIFHCLTSHSYCLSATFFPLSPTVFHIIFHHLPPSYILCFSHSLSPHLPLSFTSFSHCLSPYLLFSTGTSPTASYCLHLTLFPSVFHVPNLPLF